MTSALRYLSVLLTALFLMTAATPAQAHGGVELVILAGFIGAILLALTCAVGIVITYYVIYRFSRRASKKSGKPPTSKIKIAILSPIVFFLITVIVVRAATYSSMKEYREQIQQQEKARIDQIGKPRILNEYEQESLKKKLGFAEWDNNSQRDLANIYLRGDGVGQDCAEAMYWFSVYTHGLPVDSPAHSDANIAKNGCRDAIRRDNRLPSICAWRNG